MPDLREPLKQLAPFLLLSFVWVQNVAAQPPLDFYTGQALFEKNWIPAPASTGASDGLGPYYNARSCQQCHPGGGRGSREQSLVLHINDPVYGQQLQKFAVPGLAGEADVDYGPADSGVNSPGGYRIRSLQYGPLQNPPISPRIAPSLHGLALLEIIPDAQINAWADALDENGDGISGRVNRVLDANGESAIGRFGWKASRPTLAGQVAKALSLDLGIGNPLFPSAYGDCTAEQVLCLQAPHGNSAGQDNLEASNTVLELLLTYIRGLPGTAKVDSLLPGASRGEGLFQQIGCADCHVAEVVIKERILRPFTDLLLHDMGPGLADDLEEAGIPGSEWRTSPLGDLARAGREYLHDGRADSLHGAITWHDGEAARSRENYLELNEAQRSDLTDYMNSL